jgi:hypothetical protein
MVQGLPKQKVSEASHYISTNKKKRVGLSSQLHRKHKQEDHTSGKTEDI